MTTSSNRRTSAKRIFSLVLAVLILLCVAAGLAALPRLRQERQTLVRLQNQTERAAAPDEPVVLDDRWLALAMRWVGSRAATHRLTLVSGDGPPAIVFAGREVVLLARSDDALVRSLRSDGYTLTPEATDGYWTRWDPSGDGSALFGHAAVRIFFVLPPTSQTPPAEVPSKP